MCGTLLCPVMYCPGLRSHHTSGSVTWRAAMAKRPRNNTARKTRSVRNILFIAVNHSGGLAHRVQLRSTVAFERHTIRAGDLAEIAAASGAILCRGHAMAEPAVFPRRLARHKTRISGLYDLLHRRQDLAP